MLSDPAWAHLFTEEQRAAIERHVPWSRVLGPGPGDPAVTEALLWQRQARLVIKPNDDYGGRGVVLGWTVGPADLAGRRRPRPGRGGGGAGATRLPAAVVPGVRAGRRATTWAGCAGARSGFDCDPFLFGGKVEGAMVRVSRRPLSNVSAGGGVTGLLVRDDV